MLDPRRTVHCRPKNMYFSSETGCCQRKYNNHNPGSNLLVGEENIPMLEIRLLQRYYLYILRL